MKTVLKAVIRFYQRAMSPAMPPACRYEPTCSRYAYEAIDSHGTVRGSWLAIRRLSRCHPGREGGYDPVPEAAQPNAAAHDHPSPIEGPTH